MRIAFVQIRAGLILTALLAATPIKTSAAVGPWVPQFKGIDHSVSTNLPNQGGLPHRMVIHALRIDLSDPDVRLFPTPRISNYVSGSRETSGQTVSDFLKSNRLQAAINANFFTPEEYYLPAGTAMEVSGLAVSEGVLVSKQDSPEDSAAMIFDSAKRGAIIPSNWPSTNVAGIFNAVSGDYPLVTDGKDIARSYLSSGGFVHGVNPRTAFGLSQDKRYLFLVTIDGRQPGYSDGAYDYETAEWMLMLGAYDAINMDGGGSTTLTIQDSTTGVPVRLNKSSAVADSGRERTVGSHFGIYAKPLSGFVNDVVVLPDDTSAKVTWTTLEPASSQVQYRVNTDPYVSTSVDTVYATQHAAQLTGLTPNTGYYFHVLSSTSNQQYTSPEYFFVTTNYTTTNLIFGLSQPWKYSAANLQPSNWIASDFDDSNWSGPSPGLLWADNRPGGPNPDVDPKVTQLPTDPSNSGYPFRTYYFRTRFTMTAATAKTALFFSSLVDDGAIFYLNGREIYRLRMPDGTVGNQTLASGFPCDGDATCPDEFIISPDLLSNNLVSGENVMAVEVHNYNFRSADITFGLTLSRVDPLVRDAKLNAIFSNGSLTLTWDQKGFSVQSAASIDGPWKDVPSASESPFVTRPAESPAFFRLRK